MHFQRDRCDLGEIVSGRHEIVGVGCRQELAILVVFEVLQQSAPKPLHDRAQSLRMDRRRVDDASDVFDRSVLQHLDVAGLRVHRDMGRMRAIAVGPLVARIGAVGLQILGCDSANVRARPSDITTLPSRW